MKRFGYIYELRYTTIYSPTELRVRFHGLAKANHFMRNHPGICPKPELLRMEIKAGIIHDGIFKTVPVRQMRSGRWTAANQATMEGK